MALQVNRTVDRRRLRAVQSTGVDSLLETLDVLESRNEDHYVHGRDVAYNDDGTVDLDRFGKFTWSDLAFGQFCTKLRVPTEFLRRCPIGEGPSSKKAIVDHWKEGIDGRKLLYRVHRYNEVDPETGSEGYVRAVLSDRYGVLDNAELVRLLRPFVQEHGLKVQASRYNEKSVSMHLRLLYPEKFDMAMVGKGADLHQVGINIINSEVGFCNLQGDFLVYREICTNGLIALLDKEHLFQQRHLNIERHELRGRIVAGLECVPSYVDDMRDRMKASQEIRLENPTREMSKILKVHRANEEFVEWANEAYDVEPNATRFGIIQAITRAAQRLDNDERMRMESVAGTLLLAA